MLVPARPAAEQGSTTVRDAFWAAGHKLGPHWQATNMTLMRVIQAAAVAACVAPVRALNDPLARALLNMHVSVQASPVPRTSMAWWATTFVASPSTRFDAAVEVSADADLSTSVPWPLWQAVYAAMLQPPDGHTARVLAEAWARYALAPALTTALEQTRPYAAALAADPHWANGDPLPPPHTAIGGFTPTEFDAWLMLNAAVTVHLYGRRLVVRLCTPLRVRRRRLDAGHIAETVQYVEPHEVQGEWLVGAPPPAVQQAAGHTAV
jgi:hypothetical protein